MINPIYFLNGFEYAGFLINSVSVIVNKNAFKSAFCCLESSNCLLLCAVIIGLIVGD